MSRLRILPTPRLKAFSYHFDEAAYLTQFELFTCLAYLVRENGGFVSHTSLKEYLGEFKHRSRFGYSSEDLLASVRTAYDQDIVYMNDSRHYQAGTRVYSDSSKYKILVDEAAKYWLDNFHNAT